MRVLLTLAAWVLGELATAQSPRLETRPVVGGLTRPVFVLTPPGQPGRLFIVEQDGKVRIFQGGALLAQPFLNIESDVSRFGSEDGLLGMAFHPSYASNRKFYVSFTDNARASVVREYRTSSTDPDVANSATSTTIFHSVPHGSDHNGGCIQFGPEDGMLYLGLGDGTESGTAQRLNSYFGKMLRIDVDNPPSFVPAGNPFASGPCPLIWSYGWRNPWRFSFDRSHGDLYAADVGECCWEEIDFQPASSAGGENYGWRCMEGDHCTGQTGCTCSSSSLVGPIREFSHSSGCSVIGGYVYRGQAIPGFQGHYIYSDFCSAKFWSFTYDGSSVSNFVDRTAELDPPGPATMAGPSSFGQDSAGELYICTLDGSIYKIEGACTTPVTYCVVTPNSAGPGARMSFEGTAGVTADDLKLKCTGCPPSVTGLFIHGSLRAEAPYGNGIRCIGGSILRLPVNPTNAQGTAVHDFAVQASPIGITPGTTRRFQYWFRDNAGGGARFDLSDGLEVVFCAD